jgi:hypothetical protein
MANVNLSNLQVYNIKDSTNGALYQLVPGNTSAATAAANSVALNNIFAFLAAGSPPPAKTRVYAPAGTYSLSATINISELIGLEFFGDGPGRTTFQWEAVAPSGGNPGNTTADPDSTATSPIAGTPMFIVGNCNECVLRNFTIVANGVLDEGIRIAKLGSGNVSTHNMIDCVTFGGNTSMLLQVGVRIGSNAANSTALNQNNDVHSIRNCSFSAYADCAIAVEDSQVFQVLIENCRGLGDWPYHSLGGGTDTRLAATINTAGTVVTIPTTTIFTQKDKRRIIEVSPSGGWNDSATVRTLITAVSVGASTTDLTVSPAIPGGPYSTSIPRVRYGSQRMVRNAQGNLTGGGNFELGAAPLRRREA